MGSCRTRVDQDRREWRVLHPAHAGSTLGGAAGSHAKSSRERTQARGALRANGGAGVMMATVRSPESTVAASVKPERHRVVTADAIELALTRVVGKTTRPVPVV